MKYRVEFLVKTERTVPRELKYGAWGSFPTFTFDDRPTADKWERVVRKARGVVDARVVEVPE